MDDQASHADMLAKPPQARRRGAHPRRHSCRPVAQAVLDILCPPSPASAAPRAAPPKEETPAEPAAAR